MDHILGYWKPVNQPMPRNCLQHLTENDIYFKLLLNIKSKAKSFYHISSILLNLFHFWDILLYFLCGKENNANDFFVCSVLARISLITYSRWWHMKKEENDLKIYCCFYEIIGEILVGRYRYSEFILIHYLCKGILT